jgi:hypothetical protein
MNQLEQCFSLLQRKRLRLADFADKADLAASILAFIAQHNEHAHPLHWTTRSVAKVMAWAERLLHEAAA